MLPIPKTSKIVILLWPILLHAIAENWVTLIKQLQGDNGEQRGVCEFAHNQRCDGWDFLEGTCGQAYNVCAQRGLESIVRSDGQNPFSATHTECLDPVTGMRTVATNLIYIGATKSAQINESDEQSPQLTTDDIVNLPTSSSIGGTMKGIIGQHRCAISFNVEVVGHSPLLG